MLGMREHAMAISPACWGAAAAGAGAAAAAGRGAFSSLVWRAVWA